MGKTILNAGDAPASGWHSLFPSAAPAWPPLILMLTAALAPLPAAAGDQPVYDIPPVEVVGLSPVQGTGIDKDKVPVDVQTYSAKDMAEGHPLGVDDVLMRRLSSVSAADYQGNELQPSLQIRGYTASPVLGEPQGIAVYQDGMRVNEAFGDVVNWDMVPTFAVNQMQVLPGSNPVFGLNALGGAVSMQMKNGFNTQGGSAELAGGTFGRAKAMAEIGGHTGNFGFYTGAQAINDDGWRQYAPSRLAQSYSDLDWRGESTEVGLGLTLGASYLGNNGSAPQELLSSSWSSAWTTPDNQRDSLVAMDLRLTHDINDATSLQGNAYFRHMRSAVTNGSTSNFQDCGGGLAGNLCDGSGNQLFNINGNAIPTPGGGIAQIQNLLTVSDSAGLSGQITRQSTLFGLDNTAVAGLSLDAGRSNYTATTLVGSFIDSLRVAVADGETLGGTNYTSLRTDNLYGGAYVTDTLSLTRSLALTLAGRYNAAEVRLQDQNGTALNGDHSYTRLNPSAGLTWKITPTLTAFTDYSEANRVPTPAELGCANAALPCTVPNAFAGDPALKQVVSRSVEAGARGKIPLGGKDGINWSAAGFFSNNQNDIIFVTSPTNLTSGYFQNAGYTQRVGLETNIDGRHGALTWFAGYSLVRATFESTFTENESNPGAGTNGNITVRPGDAMPGVPMHTLKAGASYDLTSRWTIGGDMVAESGVYLRGDEANVQNQTTPYAVFGAETDYRLTQAMTAYIRANNLFDTHYTTAGVYSDGSQFGYAQNDRFLTPAAPFNLWAGMRVTF